jgi:hypothetical protein
MPAAGAGDGSVAAPSAGEAPVPVVRLPAAEAFMFTAAAPPTGALGVAAVAAAGAGEVVAPASGRGKAAAGAGSTVAAAPGPAAGDSAACSSLEWVEVGGVTRACVCIAVAGTEL